ncbi:MAG TPA: TIGR03118 family protein [Ktedonobacteraceae bacterium]|nr:TIGR03118 family protein [Ktedonobacteraceae bacterium]
MFVHLASRGRISRAPIVVSLVVLVLLLLPGTALARPHSGGGVYLQTNLVSNIPGTAPITDPNLVNPWGISFSPSGPFWISDNGTGLSTLYDGQGNIQPLVVTIPPAAGGMTGTPTGTVYNGNSNDFVVSKKHKSGGSIFLFDTEDGTLSGWNPNVDPTNAIRAVDNSSSGAVYKGLVIASNQSGTFLYAANFHAGTVDVFDKNFAPAKLSGSFSDPNLPKGYAPFGIQNIGSDILVTYAKQDKAKHDDVPGKGHGFVDVFDTNGNLIKRLISHGQLNSPWGLAMAPADFGIFSNDLLVGNFGNGHINAYDPNSGAFLGTIMNSKGKAIKISGLWGLMFGNGGQGGQPNQLFFTAGLHHEADGLFGMITLQA